MSPIILTHTSRREHRERIRREGLQPRQPSFSLSPVGVYTMPQGEDPWFWDWYSRPDMYTFAYVGRMLPDPIIEHAFVIPDPVPAEVVGEPEIAR